MPADSIFNEFNGGRDAFDRQRLPMERSRSDAEIRDAHSSGRLIPEERTNSSGLARATRRLRRSRTAMMDYRLDMGQQLVVRRSSYDVYVGRSALHRPERSAATRQQSTLAHSRQGFDDDGRSFLRIEPGQVKLLRALATPEPWHE